jgi:acetyl-CoA carboxylase carboxyltransferase component
MPIIKTKINSKSADFIANAEAMQTQVDDLNSTLATIRQGGGEKACARHVARGKLLPRERVDALLQVHPSSNSPHSQPIRYTVSPSQRRALSPA